MALILNRKGHVRTESPDPIVKSLREVAEQSPDLRDAALLYETILPVLRDADLHVGVIALTPGEASAKLEDGRPLLSGLELDIDIDAARSLMIRLAAAIEKAGKKLRPSKLRLSWLSFSGEPDSAAAQIRLALEKGTLDAAGLLTCVAAGTQGPVTALAQDLKLDPALLLTLAQNTLRPALRVWGRLLAPLARDAAWNKVTCFVCSAPATLAELQGNDQEKHLRCGSCGADWRFRRLQCPYCGNEDHKTLRYLYAENQRGKMHVEACDRCHGYHKVISSFTPTPAEMLPVEDLATVHLDYIARQRGYMRAG